MELREGFKMGEIEESRRTLLQYYNSQTMTHVGYLIALAIGSLTLISRWDIFVTSQIPWEVFLIILSIVAGLSVQILGRTLFYGNLAYEILDALPVDEKDSTIIQRLHNGCANEIGKRYWFFRGTGIRSLILMVGVALAVYLFLEVMSLKFVTFT
jgi:hypothetical protein